MRRQAVALRGKLFEDALTSADILSESRFGKLVARREAEKPDGPASRWHLPVAVSESSPGS